MQKALYRLLICVVLSGSGIQELMAQKIAVSNWKPLLNGNDLTGWETYLRQSEAAEDQSPIGLNKDPHRVFTLENGTLRISGQDWGGISTKESFSNYHLRFDVK